METNSRFTEGAQRVLQISQKIAQQLGNNYVGTEHLLIGLCMDEGGMAGKVLHNAGVDESMVVSALTRGGVMQAGGPVFDYTPRVKRIINALTEADLKFEVSLPDKTVTVDGCENCVKTAVSELEDLGFTPEVR